MLYAILARDKNSLIGSGFSLPWKNDPSTRWDMESFKRLTSGNIVFMGYRTFLGFNSPLPDRINVVESNRLSSQPEPTPAKTADDSGAAQSSQKSSFIFTSSLPDFLESYKNELKTVWSEKKIFIIGGKATVAKYANKIDCLYLTTFFNEYKGDVFLPENFQETLSKRFSLCRTLETHANGKIEMYKALFL